nr:VWA-like domain-containing protein [uncultured Mediterraneibacter sp.]
MNYKSEEAAERLKQIGYNILSICRDELYFSMRYMDVALSSFQYVMDVNVSPFGTDGYHIYFHPGQLGGLYKENRILTNRGYLHMVLHCIFRHLWKRTPNDRYWNLSCDIAVEHIIDGCDLRPVRFSRSLLRRETYRKLEADGHVLNAERIFHILSEWDLDDKELKIMEEEFYMDDHRYWEGENQKRPPESSCEQKWREIDEKMETDLETFSKESSEQSGGFLGELKAENRGRHDYREFLRKFSVFHEEMKADPDTFDYGFYSYGLSLYGNMPLIEPLETREAYKVEEFVIVLDTSMSCSGKLIRRFLEETYNVLQENDSFFRKVNIHIIQCDEKVHEDVRITSGKELEEYMAHFRLYGEGGTDFRPAFTYVDELIKSGGFTNLKGLIYFTDGYGIYPEQMPPYRTAFVFLEEDFRDVDVPSWAIRLVIREDSIKEEGFGH